MQTVRVGAVGFGFQLQLTQTSIPVKADVVLGGGIILGRIHPAGLGNGNQLVQCGNRLHAFQVFHVCQQSPILLACHGSVDKGVHIVDQRQIPISEDARFDLLVDCQQLCGGGALLHLLTVAVKVCGKTRVQLIHIPWCMAKIVEEGTENGQFDPQRDLGAAIGRDGDVGHTQHLLPDGNDLLGKGEELQYAVPIADAIVDPPVGHVGHMDQRAVHTVGDLGIPRDPTDETAENAVIDRTDEILGQRQRNARIAFHDVAVVQHNGRAVGQSSDGAGLQDVDLLPLYGKFHVRLIVEDGFDLLCHGKQLPEQSLGEQGSTVLPIVGVQIVVGMVKVSGGGHLVLYHAASQSCAYRDNGLVQDANGIGGEDHAGQPGVDHLL